MRKTKLNLFERVLISLKLKEKISIVDIPLRSRMVLTEIQKYEKEETKKNTT